MQERGCEDVSRQWIRIFTHERPVRGDGAEQRNVVGRVSASKPGGEYGDGRPAGVETSAVCGRIDAMSTAGHHDAPRQRKLSGE